MIRTVTVAVCAIFFLVPGVEAADPKPAASFELSIPGLLTARFHSVDGLGSESEIVEFRDGTSGETMKLPGRVRYGDITLKRGITSDGSLAAWRALVESGTGVVERKNGSIVVFDKSGKPVARYSFYQGWPAKVVVGLDAETGVAIETLVIAVEGISRE
jgi:phage tail-like protein